MRIKVGDIRIIKRFLFFPMYLDSETRWLEVAYIAQIYRRSKQSGKLSWENIYWADKFRFLNRKRNKKN